MMSGCCLRYALRCALAAWVGLCGAAPALAQSPDEMNLRLWREDAELADVCFLGPQLGWAVGDRGVIWHTRDGGERWEMQTSPVRCRLNSVFFVDAEHGFAAGGETTHFTHLSQGVVLTTRDGGKNWQLVPRQMIPYLERIKFFDLKQGVAFGAPSALFPSGVFTTDDGGRNWTPMPSEAGQTWLAGDFIDPNTGALAGRASTPFVVRRRQLSPARSAAFGLRGLREMQLIAPNFGWMVGDGGLVLRSADLGQTWQTTPAELPSGAGKHFDLATIAVQGSQLWVAGAPGTRVFHSPDAGQSWFPQETGYHAPIQKLAFVDPQHGWAVGGLGTILATDDGGRTWRKQRAGGHRAALLGVFGDPRQVPLELFAQLSAEEGYLGVVNILGRRDLDPQSPERDDLPQRTHAALVAVGASGAQSAWRFPLRQSGLRLSVENVLTILDRANDGHALEQLELHVVRQIRTWQPEVVVTHHASLRGEQPWEHMVNQVVLRAVETAADPTSHVELATIAGLGPWQVRKIYSTVGPGEAGTSTINTARLQSRLGRSIADQAGAARGLIATRFEPEAVEVGFRLLIDHVPQDRGREDFFSGILLTPGGDARRMLSEPLGESLDHLRRMAQKRRNMQELIRRSEDKSFMSPVLSGQLADLTSGLDASNATQLLHQLAQQYERRGSWELAAGTYESLADNYPQHPLAQSSLVWLLKYYGSGEAAWRMRQASTATAQNSLTAPPSSPQGVIQASGLGALPTQGSTTLVGGEKQQLDERLQKANELGKRLEALAPTLYAEPSLRFPLASIERKLGYGNQANRYFLQVQRGRTQDAWWAAAQAERWLEERKELPPKPLWTAIAAPAKPHLDGKLDEAFWLVARPVELKSGLGDDAAWPTRARLGYDRQFLYLGVECTKAPGVEYPTSDQPRPRDPDLSARDRVTLLLDLDRDYATYYELTIDHRGWTGETCWGDASWNPNWYVAHAETETSWTAEAAIPLAELTGIVPEKNHVWTAGIQRVVPSLGFQSWTQPASPQITPEGFGLLMFE